MGLYELVGPEVRKLHPRLRMIANGSTRVNAIRAEVCPFVAVKSSQILRRIAQVRGPESELTSLAPEKMRADRGSLQALPDGVYASVFVGLARETLRAPSIPGQTARQGSRA